MKLLVDPEWTLTDAYLDIYAKQSRDISSEKKTLKADLEMMRERAAKIYEEQCQRYDEKRDMTLADREWNRKVLTEGTISDKISAFLIQIRESPFYSMQAIAQLLALAGGASRHESYPALEAIGNVFATCILPAPSKLPESKF